MFRQTIYLILVLLVTEIAAAQTFNAPYEIPRFQSYLAECKLQAPTSSTAATKEEIANGYTSERFYVAEDDKIAFNQSGASMRTELRHETNWTLSEGDRSLHGRLKFVEQTCDQVTVVQIHDDANAGNGPNKPLLRIYKHLTKSPANHLWAAIKTDEGGENTTHIDLGIAPPDYFDWDVSLEDGHLIVAIDGVEKANEDVSFWTFPSYWKAGVYLQDDGEATVYFDTLEEGNGDEIVSIEGDLSKDISIYPNPTDSFITIDIVNHQLLDGMLTLSDATGIVLKQLKVGNKEMRLQLPEKRGLYFIIIKKEELTKSFKVIRR